MQNIFLILGMILIFIGCGSSQDSRQSMRENFPQNIVLSLPLKLEENREMLTNQSTKSYTYEMMQFTLLKIRDKSSELQFNSILIQKVFPEIEAFCSDFVKGESCTIPAGTFFIQLTKPELRALKKRYGALDIVFEVNSSLSFGEMILVKEMEDTSYDYRLKVDILNIYQSIMGEAYETFYNQKMLKKQQNFAWSHENNNSYVSLEEESSLLKEVFTMELLMTKENKEIAHVYRKNQYLESSSMNTLTWIKNNDHNNSYNFTYNDNYTASQGKISDGLGFHLESSFYDNAQTVVFFDNNGFELGQDGCGGYDGCLLDDKSTWSTVYEEELNASVLDELAQFELFARNIIDQNSSLEEGEYFLVPKDVLLEENLNETILQQHIGKFLVNNQEAQGILYNQEFTDGLDGVSIYRGLSMFDNSYQAIEEVAYPNFIVQNEIKEEVFQWYE
ncbi:MAG: Unknown protein [uncultured Sulfurovum sp.]|uniref:Uncharacterized protein n=1 Tax=uncultured Sulfurovum sp. TaxID=269237 RepID=A0A6S6S3U8_9BACT|nr:MAG: Unknown protein [uncultured Sulfurovum sp.]